MLYVASNFIASFLSTSKVLRFLLPDGTISFSINVCNYQKSSVSDIFLNIVMEDSDTPYQLQFSSVNEAQQALSFLKQAIDTLSPNCGNPITFTPPAGTPIPVSYLQYKSLQLAGSLVPLQWYDVTDTTGLILITGTTIRLLALQETDLHPSGTVLDSSNAKISIDCITDQVVFYEKPDQKITLIDSNPLQQTIDSNSNNIIGKSGSVITSINSNNLEISKSTVSLTNSSKVKIFNSSITLSGAQNCIIDNITQVTPPSFALTNVEIDSSSTIGKVAVTRTPVSVDTLLIAYRDPIENEVTLNTNNNTINITLKNEIITANSEFRIKYTGTGTGNKINIKKFNTTLLYTIIDAQKNYWVVFKYVNGDYEFLKVDYGDGLNGVHYVVSPVTNGQTAFLLPIAPIIASKLEMSINGQIKYFGLDFTYSSGSQTVTYLNSDFTIASTDVVEFVIF